MGCELENCCQIIHHWDGAWLNLKSRQHVCCSQTGYLSRLIIQLLHLMTYTTPSRMGNILEHGKLAFRVPRWSLDHVTRLAAW